MKLQERLKREYRLLALAVVFFVAGAIFFWYDASLPSARSGASRSASAPQSAQSTGRGGGQTDPDFGTYPAPSQFRTFVYDKKDINGSPALAISAPCHDAYLAFLIFPTAFDYRDDAPAAVYNKAFPCQRGQSFTLTITAGDLATELAGTYYYFSADEGKTGTWYNPK